MPQYPEGTVEIIDTHEIVLGGTARSRVIHALLIASIAAAVGLPVWAIVG